MHTYHLDIQIENQLEDAYAEYQTALNEGDYNRANKFVQRMSAYGLSARKRKEYLSQIAEARIAEAETLQLSSVDKAMMGAIKLMHSRPSDNLAEDEVHNTKSAHYEADRELQAINN